MKADWNPAEHQDVDERMAQMAHMRAQCPVGFTHTRADHWTVTRYKDLMAVAGNAEAFSNGGDPRFGRRLPPLEVDPPEHGLFRQALQRFWLPSRMRKLEPRVVQSVDTLLTPLLERGGLMIQR
jgi:cytochrome P450